MKDRFTTFNDKKAKQLATVKQAAKEKVAARENACSEELEKQARQIQSSKYREARAATKEKVPLEADLKASRCDRERASH